MQVLSAAEMQACDRATTERFGVSSLELMRNASAAVAACAREQFPRARRVTVLCGRGNNGGDGMMAARRLAETGVDVTVLLLGDPAGLKGDAASAWRELQAAESCRIAIIESDADLSQHQIAFETDLIVDAVVGTGFQPPLKGIAAAALEFVARSSAPVLAVDLPSGWAADETRAAIDEAAFPADAVVTFTAPKPAHVFGQLTSRWSQPVIVAPIGSPDEAVVSRLNLHWAGAAQSLLHQERAAGAHKGNFGHVLVVGGSFGPAGGKAGAPSMASLAALRAGAGLVTAAVPAPAIAVVSGFAPELMTRPLETGAEGEILPANAAPERLAELTRGITVLAAGPGMGQGEDATKFLARLLTGTRMPAVIDADGLNILAQSADLMAGLGRDGRTIALTPHPGEMARLAGISTAEVQADRVGIARRFAAAHGVTVVLKGARTIIAHPEGRIAVNTTGNPGMAKGGSGDLLTGVIAALLAQFPEQTGLAVEAAVHLHGLAADFAVRRSDEHVLLATDSLREFSRAFRFSSRGTNGYVWLQGQPRHHYARRSTEAGE